MNKILFAAGAGALALIGGATAFAESGMMPGHGPMADETRAQFVQKLDERFARLDLNHDGTVTRAEVEAGRKARQDAVFKTLDANGDGSISRAEFDAARGGPDGNDDGHRGHGGPHGGFRHGGGFGHGDGKLFAPGKDSVTKAEFEGRALARFDRMDANHDGTVTAAEHKAAWSAMKAQGVRPQD